MFGLSATELVIIVLLALVLLGPDRLPGAARMVRNGLRELRRASDGLKETFERETEGLSADLESQTVDLRQQLNSDVLDLRDQLGAEAHDLRNRLESHLLAEELRTLPLLLDPPAHLPGGDAARAAEPRPARFRRCLRESRPPGRLAPARLRPSEPSRPTALAR